MDCKLKEMSSYQRLKWELDQEIEENEKLKEELKKLKKVLWEIFMLEGPDLVKAPKMARNTLYGNLIQDTHEKN